jgi:hypothetical protein
MPRLALHNRQSVKSSHETFSYRSGHSYQQSGATKTFRWASNTEITEINPWHYDFPRAANWKAGPDSERSRVW